MSLSFPWERGFEGGAAKPGEAGARGGRDVGPCTTCLGLYLSHNKCLKALFTCLDLLIKLQRAGKRRTMISSASPGRAFYLYLLVPFSFMPVCTCVSIHTCAHPPTHNPSTHLSIYKPTNTHPPIYPSSICPPTHPSIHLPIFPSIYPLINHSTIHLHIQPPIIHLFT